jgi:hypothetical protein
MDEGNWDVMAELSIRVVVLGGMVTVITDYARRLHIQFQPINVNGATNLRQSVLKISGITAILR